MDKQGLYNAYNGTSVADENGEIESYVNWLERQLISRINKLEEIEKREFTEMYCLFSESSCPRLDLLAHSKSEVKEKLFVLQESASRRNWEVWKKHGWAIKKVEVTIKEK